MCPYALRREGFLIRCFDSLDKGEDGVRGQFGILEGDSVLAVGNDGTKYPGLVSSSELTIVDTSLGAFAWPDHAVRSLS